MGHERSHFANVNCILRVSLLLLIIHQPKSTLDVTNQKFTHRSRRGQTKELFLNNNGCAKIMYFVCAPRDDNRSFLSNSLASVKMDAGEEKEKARSRYYKNLWKEQKKGRRERKSEEERVKQEEVRRSQFQELVNNIKRKVEAEEEPGDQEVEMFDPQMIEEAIKESLANPRNQSRAEKVKSTGNRKCTTQKGTN